MHRLRHPLTARPGLVAGNPRRARRYIHKDRIDAELERAVGRVVRAFDPCIACATH